MDAFGLNKKTSGLWPKNKNNETDEVAKSIRERVRIVKEAAESYQYWRKAVGDENAFDHVKNEFGNLLDEQNLNSDNIGKLRENLLKLREELEARPESKPVLEGLKEIDKELAQLGRKDFEKTTEEFASKIQIEIDSLTRAWEIFNNVRQATGDIELAVNISGAEYDGNKSRNLAEALRSKLENEFMDLGSSIDFDINLSNREITDLVQKVIPKGSEERIKGFVEEYKKWRDLQREVLQKDIDVFSRMISSAVDLQSEVRKINSEYETMIESLDRLKEDGRISSIQYDRGKAIAESNRDMNLVNASRSFQLLMDGVVTMSKRAADTVKKEFTNALNKQLKSGAITAKDYANKIKEINERMEELRSAPSYFQSYMQGGLNGIINNIQKRGESQIENGAAMMQDAQSMINSSFKPNGNFQNFMDGIKQMNSGKQMAMMGQGMQQMGGQMASTIAIIDAIIHGIDGIVQGLKNTFDEIREMYDALGYDTESDGWQDFNTFFTSFSNASASATKGWDSLKNGDIGGVIEGVVGSVTNWITGFAKGHDAKRERQIQLAKEQLDILKNIDSRLSDSIERTLGGGTKATSDEKSLSKFDDDLNDWYKRANLIQMIFGVNLAKTDTVSAMEQAKKNMSAYSALYASMLRQRDEVKRQLEAEKDKKNSDSSAIEEYEQQIYELQEQIKYFIEDTANSLWGLDLKDWADQIGDALMTAFENGEDAMKAFEQVAKDIIRSVASEMLKIGVIEPMMENLRSELFSKEYTDSNGNTWRGVYNQTTGRFDEEKTLDILGRYFGKGGEMEKTVEASEQFYEWVKKITGIDLEQSESSSSSSSGIKSITEQTAALLASYINAIRADVSVLRAVQAEFIPQFKEFITSANLQLVGINQHVEEIERTNQIIAEKIESIDDNINGLKKKTWKLPIE